MMFILFELRKKYGTRIAMAANLPYPSFNKRKQLCHDCFGLLNMMLNLYEYI